MIFEWDDFGCNHIISDMCQSHDCRDQLDKLHLLNPNFKATLFAIPWEMTPELALWCARNSSWIEVAVHGFGHASNYECEKMTYEEMERSLQLVWGMWPKTFIRAFRAPGWQISDDCLKYLADNDWIICDQDYNNERRSVKARAYVNFNGQFKTSKPIHLSVSTTHEKPIWADVDAYHGHTWDVGWNGIYEDFEKVKNLVQSTNEFKFITELF